MKHSKLYLIPTTLATATEQQVLSPQIFEIVPQLTVFFVENIRTARRFISSLKLDINIATLHFEVLDKKTSSKEIADYFQKYLNQDIGILSEAGCPGIADPGAKAVEKAHDLDIRVIPLVGPSSIFLALMASGMSGQSFTFYGYLPIEKSSRKKKILWLEKRSMQEKQTQIFMETPYRNKQLLQDILNSCQAHTRLCIACNITAKDELIQTKTIKNWKNDFPDLHKKPTVFLLETSS